MNLTTFKTNLLLFWSVSNREEGKISIGSIVLFILFGILGIAIILPSFLSESTNCNNFKKDENKLGVKCGGCGDRPKINQGRSYVGATVRAQQAYRLENSSFAPTFTDLKIGLPTQTENYIFKITSDGENSTTVEAISLKPKDLRSYAGRVFTDTTTGTRAMECQTTAPSNIPPIPDAANHKCITGEPMY